MKHTLLYLFLILLTSKTFSQINLVPNPSFEQFTTCPINDGQINYAIGWYNLENSPDYYNSCSINPNFSVPFNWGGYQSAATGSAYCGLGTYAPCCPNLREFIGTQLSNPLVVGTKYYISFKVNLSISDDIQSYMATNKTGVLFSMNSYTLSAPPLLNNFAHIYTNTIITDTLNWTTISGSFIADSAYQFMSIGNFFHDINTDTISYRSDSAFRFAYYFIDDVCVSSDSICTSLGMGGINFEKTLFNIYPNPFKSIIYIDKYNLDEPYNISVYNLLGEKLYSDENIRLDRTKIELNPLIDSEIFFLKITSKKHSLNYKLLKQ